MLNVSPSSRAGSLPQFFESCAGVVFVPKKLWEPSLLAIAVGQLAGMLNVSPSSRAGSRPQLFESYAGVVFVPQNLWEPSLLAIAVGELAGMRWGEQTAELQ